METYIDINDTSTDREQTIAYYTSDVAEYLLGQLDHLIMTDDDSGLPTLKKDDFLKYLKEFNNIVDNKKKQYPVEKGMDGTKIICNTMAQIHYLLAETRLDNKGLNAKNLNNFFENTEGPYEILSIKTEDIVHDKTNVLFPPQK